jgi:hypothetical protein
MSIIRPKVEALTAARGSDQTAPTMPHIHQYSAEGGGMFLEKVIFSRNMLLENAKTDHSPLRATWLAGRFRC